VLALADPDSLRFWTVARHRMAIVPGGQFALQASAAPRGFHALGSVAAGGSGGMARASPDLALALQRHFVTVGVAVPDMGRPPPDHRGL
jgi:hypothetical protein